MKIFDSIKGEINLTNNDFIASGGEGKVYNKGNIAYKIYHDDKRCIPEKKINELAVLNSKNILGPRSVVRCIKKQNPIGFAMPYIQDTISICKLFTKTYRNQIGFSEKDTIELVEKIQDIVSFIHSNKCLIVDLNEYSILLDKKNTPYFIDVDSWQTQSFKATALMESVRDRKVKNQLFTEESDWFSWSIIMFQLYVGIHPYKGKHPSYLPKDWSKRMDDNVSVFDKNCVIPKSCRPFNIIPKSHLEWFENVFEKGERGIPPKANQIGIVPIETKLIVIKSTENFTAEKVFEFKELIIDTFAFGSSLYVLTKNNVYLTGNKFPIKNLNNKNKNSIFNSQLGIPYLASLDKDGKLTIEKIKVQVNEDSFISEINSIKDFFVRNNNLYTIVGDKLMENVFLEGKDKIIHSTRFLGKVLPNATKIFNGCVYQNLLGEHSFMIPYGEKRVFFKIIKELSGYRIVDAKSEENILIVLGEKSGVLTRFIFVFDEKFQSYSIRKTENIDLEPINFTKIPNKICVLYKGNESIEIFIDNDKIKNVNNAPIDGEMSLFNFSEKIYFTNDKEIYQLNLEKSK